MHDVSLGGFSVIVCVTEALNSHQPSALLFEYFDELILLMAGGRTVYHGELGEDSRTLLDYLEANGAEKCPPKTNPAEVGF